MKLYENFINDGTLTNFYGGKTDSGYKLQINQNKMTAVEKAKELVDNYRIFIRLADKYEYLDPEDELDLAKKCALVAVNEILIENSKRGGENDEIIEYEPYWQEVQQQLSKL